MPNPSHLRNRYRKNMSPFNYYEGENNTEYRVWDVRPWVHGDDVGVIALWISCYGLYRGLPIIPNRSCPDYDKRRKTNDPDK
jgi:hypothetical protein